LGTLEGRKETEVLRDEDGNETVEFERISELDSKSTCNVADKNAKEEQKDQLSFTPLDSREVRKVIKTS
jgi:hypothetical protein